MLVTTGNEISGRSIVQYLGIVVRAPTISQNLVGGFKSILGGHIEEFTEVCERAHLEAYDRMVQHAQDIGTDAIIGARMTLGKNNAAIRKSLQQLEEAGATWWLQALYMERNSIEAMRAAIRQGPPGS